MLDIKFIRENQELVRQSVKSRALKLDIDGLIKIDDVRRKVLAELEELRSQRNKANDEIGLLLKEKKDAKPKISSMKEISSRINELEGQLKEQEAELNKLLLNIPNVPHPSIPVGDASQNKVVRGWGKEKKFDFKPLTHIELCQNLDIIDFNR
ncbi:serine--tRNA ligase, partial [bacterium]